jgi:drug/metabolite transporter (DMT)-like permease
VVVIVALAAAACFALASVLQQQAAVAVPAEHRLRLGLITRLVRRPRWLAGILADLAGYGLQVYALDNGPLALVQPLLAAGLLLALLFNVTATHRGLRQQDWIAALATAAGLAIFIALGAPKGAASEPAPWTWVAFTTVTAAAVVVALALALRRGPAGRAALFAAGAGIAFALCAALTKQSLAELHEGVRLLLTTGYVYGLAACGAIGMLLAQSAFQSGALAASLPMLSLSEPVYAVVAGAVLFHEHLRSGWHGAIAVLGAVVAATAVVYLAKSPSAQPVIAP